MLLPEPLLLAWRGREAPDVEGFYSDLERASQCMDYVETLEVGAGFGIVLGDQSMLTAPIPTERGLLLVRWREAPDEGAIRQALGRLESLQWVQERFTIQSDERPLRLFPARRTGLEITRADEDPEDEDWPRLTLKAGTYAVATVEYEPREDLSLVLHALMRT